METIHISPLTIQASRIGLGTWAMGGAMAAGASDAESIKTIIAALNQNINLIDTAPVYGFGIAEKIVGKALQEYGARDKIIIATKVGLDWRKGQVTRNLTPKRMRKELADSLKRLQTDYIDIYQIHWPDPNVAIEEVAELMLAFLNEGKIRAIGVSNFSTRQMQAFMQVAPIHTSQPPYNLFERDIEKNIFPFTEKYNIPTLAHGPLCRGLLSGRITLETQFLADDIRKADPKFKAPNLQRYLTAVEALDKFSQHEFGQRVLSLAVRWILDHGRTIALWAARHPEELKPVKSVMGWTINADAMKVIDNIIKLHVPNAMGAEFMAPGARESTEEL